jgi:hypothetical protein
MVAMAVLLLDHVPPVVASLRVSENPVQVEVKPVIEAGDTLIFIAFVVKTVLQLVTE